nr:hypothetical protein [Tanacetum cinerariifolium]
QEPILFNQDPGENSLQSPPHIDHHCCYGCGDSLDGIFCRRCTCESCGNGAHIGYNYPPKVPIISNPKPCHNQNVDEFPQTLPSFHLTCYSGDENSFAYDPTSNFVDDSPNVFNPPSQPRYIIISELPPCIAIILVLSTEEPKDSLIMRDEHLDTILEKESDEFIKSSVENLVPNPNESEDLSSIRKSLLNQDSSIISSSKIDSLLDEFAGELIFLKSIPPGIDEADCDPEEEIRLIEEFLYDNSSHRLPEEFNSENSDAIDLSLTPDDSMLSGIENDDYDSERDILFLEELLSNDSLSLPENESFYFDVPSSPLPPAKPPDDDEIEPDTRILTLKVMGDIFEHYVLMPRLLPTQPTFALNEEKYPHILSHRGYKAFQLSSESPMMIYGGDNPTLDVSFFHFYPP